MLRFLKRLVSLVRGPEFSEEAIVKRIEELDAEDEGLYGTDIVTVIHGKWPEERKYDRARAIASLRRDGRS